MSHTSEPQPKPWAGRTSWFEWPVARRRACAPIRPPPNSTFLEIVEDRRSIREIRTAPVRDVVNVLAFATRPRWSKDNDDALRTRRPSVSAGALHPISTVIVNNRRPARVVRYDPMLHQLQTLSANEDLLKEFHARCASMLPLGNGSLIALVADPAITESSYRASESLVWRDAGALIQMLALVTQAFGLAYCPLGCLGAEVAQAIDASGGLRGVGAAVIGRRRQE